MDWGVVRLRHGVRDPEREGRARGDEVRCRLRHERAVRRHHRRHHRCSPSSDSAALFAADFYGVHDALPPLYRSRAVWAMNNATLTRIRQLDTAGGSNMLTPNLQLRVGRERRRPRRPGHDRQPGERRPVRQGRPRSVRAVAAFADNALIAVFGAFNPYFKIIDRVGLASSRRRHMCRTRRPGSRPASESCSPTGASAAKVVHANAFRTLRVA